MGIEKKKKAHVQCFDNIEVFANGEPMQFDRTKAKKILAYLPDANGAACSNNEIIVNQWNDDKKP